MKEIIAKSLSKTKTYEEFRTLVSDLLIEKKATGNEQSEALYRYSLLNDRRMKRLDKTAKLSESMQETLKKVDKPQTWIVLTEGWCGDAAQSLPVLNKMAGASPNINLKVGLRDENEELMAQFLTNGGRAIPKLIAIDAQENILFDWGPRPTLATKMIADYKAENGKVDAQVKQDLQVWYNKNKGENIQEDFIALLTR